MRQPHGRDSTSGSPLYVGRTGLASFVFALFHPRHAKAARVSTDSLTLTRSFGLAKIPFRKIETTKIVIGWFWGGIQVRHASGTAVLSGLPQPEARALADALEGARVDWWRRTLAAHGETLRSVDDRLAQLADPPRYMARNVFSGLERDARDVVAQFPSLWPDKLSGIAEIRMLKATQDFFKGSEAYRARANNTFIVNELCRSRKFFDRIEARPLTDEQRRSVVVDEDRNLVVAAAGSGKTSVIVAKAGWLLQKGYRHPSEMLLLAFSRDARKEMEGRVRGRLGEAAAGLTVRTFHSLGMSIIGEAEGRRPALAKVAGDEKALFDLLKDIIADLLADPIFATVMLAWFREHFVPYCSEHEFRNQGEYWDYVRANEIRSLQGEKLKSFEECEIANFLYLNGVPYEYERPYEHETATSKRRQYQPDFYLPDAGIYIEHFALSASGDTPPFIGRKEYLRSVKWKRRLHVEHGTVLIETFSHEKTAGKLTENLAAKLADHGVTLSPIPPSEIFAVLERQGRVERFTRLVATFLHHYKGAQLSAEELARRAANAVDRPRAEAFLSIFELIFERYQDALDRSRQIDFHDMINKATEQVESGRYCSPFGYILVDEFQDISPGRARLLKALLDRSPTAQLFAVGDDWQAIYRFAGSDIAIIREFRERFGATERIDLATTFRCADRIAAVATHFVLSNPAQIRKHVSSTFRASRPCVHVGLPGKEGPGLLAKALRAVAGDGVDSDAKSTVLLLGRYRRSRPENMAGLEKAYPGLELDYKTVHGSKGLEADYVVVLDLCSGKYGFPAEIADDPLLDLVLAAPEEHPNAEERRLLYVAITRARRGVFLLASGRPPSPFVMELLAGGYDVTVFGRLPESDVPCPTCVKGRLERRRNTQDRSVFYGCSHWPYCDYTQSACPHCGTGLLVKTDGTFGCRDCSQTAEACPMCSGWLKTKRGKHGAFLGCSNWPICDYTRNI